MHDIPPSIRWLSSRLERPRGIISTTINAVKRDTEALRNAQVQETGRAEERHTEAMEGQKQLKIAAYRAALEEYTRDRVPLDWASAGVKFAADSLLEGDGFELPVPREMTTIFGPRCVR
jgi:hypothetical protein